MTVLDSVIELQRGGMSDQDIAQQLKTSGASPQEINDAINQAKIKTAVSPIQQEMGGQQMQQSIMQRLNHRSIRSQEQDC